MTYPTDEELDEMASDLCHTGELSMLYRCEISDAITSLRAQLAAANARADRAEAALAAQIEVDAGIVESERKLWDQGYNTSSTGHCVCLSLAKVRDAILARADQIEKGEL